MRSDSFFDKLSKSHCRLLFTRFLAQRYTMHFQTLQGQPSSMSLHVLSGSVLDERSSKYKPCASQTTGKSF
ncbi:hypothetical protein B0T09DRAFT_172290 [Sordaria sp. MPI-SDFR-AT-0083]|nr:hypothetical protein B0T09DRAFT_172290 [Sordaria sp. MPI-SDFR-AT-0083]